MKNVKVTLKKIAFYERMSEETNCFAADLYINGKKVGEAKNDGQGGCTNYYGNSKENNEVIRQAEEYYKSLPMITPTGYSFKYQPTLDHAIDEQLELYLKTKAEKKKQKLMETAILFGKPDGMSYSYIKQKTKLSQFHVNSIQNLVNQIKRKYCTDGVVILNTNLEQLGVTI
jgi:hypothetical protein